MNFLKRYYKKENNEVVISATQGNDFAKKIANDFNPIHDTNAKRFCVPGDLLFAIALNHYGLHKDMTFQFRELVKADSRLIYPSKPDNSLEFQLDVINAREKAVLNVQAKGKSSQDAQQIEQLIRNYVAFSGHNFPHILVPLMQEHKVMINPARPLVIYENMSLHFDTLEFADIDIELERASLSVDGKRGDTNLHFSISSEGIKVGSGLKKLVLSGLREYQQAAIDDMCQRYAESVSKNS